MSYQERTANGDTPNLVALASVPGFGAIRIKRILERRKKIPFTWKEFWSNSKSIWKKLQITEQQQDSLREWRQINTVESIQESVKKAGCEVVTITDALYPQLLKEIHDPPVVLFVKNAGTLKKLTKPVAVVGSRRNTEYGKRATSTIVSGLVKGGAQIVSGGMYGIDLLAHQACVEQGGTTVIVLGYGMNHVYPRQLHRYYTDFMERGVVFISEHLPDVAPLPGLFPQRNRIVAGMSYATLVVEASEKSGSHITAQLALEYGRMVGAVPGSIFSTFSDGTRSLLKQGASMVGSAEDILEEITPQLEETTVGGGEQLELPIPIQLEDTKSREIYKHLGTSPQSIEELTRLCTLKYSDVVITLTELEIQGHASRRGHMWVKN